METLGCVTARIIENIKKSLQEAPEIDGYEALSPEDQAKVNKAWEDGHVADEDIPDTARKPEAEDDEDKPKKKRAPAKKAAAAAADADEEPKEKPKRTESQRSISRKRRLSPAMSKKSPRKLLRVNPVLPRFDSPFARWRNTDRFVQKVEQDDDGESEAEEKPAPKKRAPTKKAAEPKEKKAPAKKRAPAKAKAKRFWEDFAKDIAEVTADEDDADEPEEEREKPAKKQPAKKAPAKAAPKKKTAPSEDSGGASKKRKVRSFPSACMSLPSFLLQKPASKASTSKPASKKAKPTSSRAKKSKEVVEEDEDEE
ncbi:zf-PARP-domain-containing protein [Salix suchowensis]|nr:zf-PARP-domain-containing protein [Salix suchowensis]